MVVVMGCCLAFDRLALPLAVELIYHLRHLHSTRLFWLSDYRLFGSCCWFIGSADYVTVGRIVRFGTGLFLLPMRLV